MELISPPPHRLSLVVHCTPPILGSCATISQAASHPRTRQAQGTTETVRYSAHSSMGVHALTHLATALTRRVLFACKCYLGMGPHTALRFRCIQISRPSGAKRDRGKRVKRHTNLKNRGMTDGAFEHRTDGGGVLYALGSIQARTWGYIC